MVKSPMNEVGKMLQFLNFPDYRLYCVNENLEGDFHREHHAPGISFNHLFDRK